MIFRFSANVATILAQCIPAHQRSRYLAEAVAEKLAEKDRRLPEAVIIVNVCLEILEVEAEWDALPDVESELGAMNGLDFDVH